MPSPRSPRRSLRRSQGRRGRAHTPPPDGDLWIFAYGSLMWRPGFAPLETRPALLRGYHRALCIYSHVWRGTPECPGLVLGLDRGGSCRGRAYRIAAADAGAVLAEIDARELVTEVYVRRRVPVALPEGTVAAYTYVVDRAHPQYAGRLAPEAAADYVIRGVGRSGACRDYVENTVAHLDELGIRDSPLHLLRDLVREKAGPR